MIWILLLATRPKSKNLLRLRYLYLTYLEQLVLWGSLKVSKFQKQIFLFSFEPKNDQNYFLNSALASKMSQIKKMKAHYYINKGYLIQWRHQFFYLTHFKTLGQKSKNNFVLFLVQMRTRKFAFEINWPLAGPTKWSFQPVLGSFLKTLLTYP